MAAGGSSLTEWSVPHPWPASSPARLVSCPSRERPVFPGRSPGLTGAKGAAEGGDRLRQGDCCLAGDVSFGLVLGVGVDELGVLVLDVLGVLAERAEQQRLQVAEQVLAGLLGYLPVGHSGLQAADQAGGRRGDRGQCGGRRGSRWAPRGGWRLRRAGGGPGGGGGTGRDGDGGGGTGGRRRGPDA